MRPDAMAKSKSKRDTDDDLDDDDVPLVASDYSSYPWEKEPVVKEVPAICDSLEMPPLDPRVSYELQKTYYRKNQFGEDGRGHVIMTLRCLTESAGNEAALAEPVIVRAASDCWLNWRSLVELSWVSLPAARREEFEKRIIAGENVKGSEIARARCKRRKGRPKAARMAA